MKVLIVNEADLTYEEIGKMIDMIAKEDVNSAIYYKKTETGVLGVNNISIFVQRRYFRRYIEYTFKELNASKE